MSRPGRSRRTDRGKSLKGSAPRRTLRDKGAMVADGTITREASCLTKIAYSVGGAEAARRALGKKKKHVSIYHCRFCGGYHLTSMG